MADIGTARSNDFRVKDPEAFQEFAEELGLKAWQNEKGRWAIRPDMEQSWTALSYDADPYVEGGSEAFDFNQALAAHLAEGSVAVLKEVSSDLSGFATAICSNGKTVEISLDEIYDRARKAFGDDVEITCEGP